MRERARLLLAALCVTSIALGACDFTKRARMRGRQPDAVVRDVPSVLRNTIGAQATIRGLEPILVSGYGIVVNLNGTGSADVPAAIRAQLEREMSLRGIGQEQMGMGWTSPTAMLNDPNTAVVLVQASVPPGAGEGTRFDVIVEALPGTATTSLEGGLLYSTDLRMGVQLPGGPAQPPVASARGDIFINPFADPAKDGEDSIIRTSGRILSGGVVMERRDLTLVLDSPSHARARSIVNAINTSFPRGDRDREQTARGASEELIQLAVPGRYANDPEEFLQLLLHTRVDQLFGKDWAVRYANALRSEPAIAEDLSWCLQAIGEAALPALRELYDYPELIPRHAAIRAGARLGDPLVTPYLKQMALSGPESTRTMAIDLLGDMPVDPEVNLALRELLSAPALDVRVAAFEALSRRFEPSMDSRGVDGKFRLDEINAKEKMIYISQQAEPRIVLIGDDIEIERPTFVAGWDDRLMLNSESPTDPLRVYYRDFRSGAVITSIVPTDLDRFIEFLAHEPTPEDPSPGLGLSYSEVVGALHELWKADAFAAAFVAEQDKAAAELVRALTPIDVGERPEFDGQSEETLAEEQLDEEVKKDLSKTYEAKPTKIVPIPPPDKKGGGG